MCPNSERQKCLSNYSVYNISLSLFYLFIRMIDILSINKNDIIANSHVQFNGYKKESVAAKKVCVLKQGSSLKARRNYRSLARLRLYLSCSVKIIK